MSHTTYCSVPTVIDSMGCECVPEIEFTCSCGTLNRVSVIAFCKGKRVKSVSTSSFSHLCRQLDDSCNTDLIVCRKPYPIHPTQHRISHRVPFTTQSVPRTLRATVTHASVLRLPQHRKSKRSDFFVKCTRDWLPKAHVIDNAMTGRNLILISCQK